MLRWRSYGGFRREGGGGIVAFGVPADPLAGPAAAGRNSGAGLRLGVRCARADTQSRAGAGRVVCPLESLGALARRTGPEGRRCRLPGAPPCPRCAGGRLDFGHSMPRLRYRACSDGRPGRPVRRHPRSGSGAAASRPIHLPLAYRVRSCFEPSCPSTGLAAPSRSG